MSQALGPVYGSTTDGQHTELITSRSYIGLALWVMGIGHWGLRSSGGTFMLDYPAPAYHSGWATVREIA